MAAAMRKPFEPVLDHSLVDLAERVAPLGAALEVHHVASAHEVLLAPADPADHVGLVVAAAPEIGTCIE
jgi:hypothetical protein